MLFREGGLERSIRATEPRPARNSIAGSGIRCSKSRFSSSLLIDNGYCVSVVVGWLAERGMLSEVEDEEVTTTDFSQS
jgi:hypothetical protein